MPTLYIVRGLPGSGKSTLAKRLVPMTRHRESDQFWGDSPHDHARIGEAHEWCRSQVQELLRSPEDCAVSNTFTRVWEYAPYVDMARKAGLEVQIIECHSHWPKPHIPTEVVQRMRSRWEPSVMPLGLE